MKNIKFIVVITIYTLLANLSYSQLGWQPYTGQPTSTMMGSVAGAGLGYMLAPAISKGPDAQWIGALAGLAAGGLLGNYMAGDNIQHQQIQQYQQQPQQQSFKPINRQNIPLAIPLGKNNIQSPYSEFTVSITEYAPGSVVNDPLEGKLFRIPR